MKRIFFCLLMLFSVYPLLTKDILRKIDVEEEIENEEEPESTSKICWPWDPNC